MVFLSLSLSVRCFSTHGEEQTTTSSAERRQRHRVLCLFRGWEEGCNKIRFSSKALKRILRESKDLQKDPPTSCSAGEGFFSWFCLCGCLGLFDDASPGSRLWRYGWLCQDASPLLALEPFGQPWRKKLGIQQAFMDGFKDILHLCPRRLLNIIEFKILYVYEIQTSFMRSFSRFTT